jgi:UDPglucose 6-dehydrogenase
MRITIVGTGYVGLVTGTCFANTGNHVICLDVDQAKIDQLEAGELPIYEPGLEELIRRNVKAERLHFTTDKAAAYEKAEVVFICVGTPANEQGRADLRYVMEVARDIGDAIERRAAGNGEAGRRAPIVVVKSTVPVGTTAKVKAEIASRTGKPFRIAVNPEFLKEGAAVADFNKPDRVVIGCEDKRTGERLRELYEPFVRQGNPIFLMEIASAEMVKYASNAMLATKISFINEVATLCEAFGADVDEVRRGMCADRRIGNQFLYPGLGYGGSCFPKDVAAVISMGQDAGAAALLMAAVHQVNQRQRTGFFARLDRYFKGGWEGRRIAVWGIAFKPGTDDIREAPSITLIQQLLAKQAEVVVYDPVALRPAREVFGERIGYAADAMSALDGAEALVICTEWDEFRLPDFDEVKQRMNRAVIFDGRNIYRLELMREYGIEYHSIGRKTVKPAPVRVLPMRGERPAAIAAGSEQG